MIVEVVCMCQVGRVHERAAVVAGVAGRARAAADGGGAALGVLLRPHQPSPWSLDHQLPSYPHGAVLPSAKDC